MDVQTSQCGRPTECLVESLDTVSLACETVSGQGRLQLKLALPCESQPDHFRVSSRIRASTPGVYGTSSKVLTRIFLMDYGYQGMAKA